MTVILFGATGFVGRNLARRFARDGREVVAVSRSGATVPEAARSVGMADLDEDIGPLPADAVVCHVAAQRYDAGRFGMAQSDILTANVDLTTEVFAFCARQGVKEVRMASSVAVYPAGLAVMDDADPVDLNAAPYPNEAMYAWSKRWGEVVAGLYAEKYGVSTVAFRLSNPYGPFDSTDPAAAHVLPAFVIRALQPGDAFPLKGDPYVERDFIYVDDVAEVFSRSLDWRGRSERYNLCRGETDTLHDLAVAILELSSSPKALQVETDFAPAAVRARRSTAARVKEAFGIEAFTPLREGLEPTIAWYREQLHA